MGVTSAPGIDTVVLDDTRGDRFRRRVDRASSQCEADLLSAVRAGEFGAYEEIYDRHHHAVQTLARRLCRDRHEADDVVSEVFCKTLRALGNGAGPRDDAGPYLLRSVRHTVASIRSCKDTGRATPFAEIDDRDGEDQLAVGGPATEAWLGVTERFRDVLWSVEVQGYGTGDVAASEHIDPPAAASLMLRARRALRRSYVRGSITTPVEDEQCRPIRSLLVAFAEDTVSANNRSRVEVHLEQCASCASALGEVRSAQRRLAERSWVVLVPSVLRSLALDVGHVFVGAGSLVPLAVVGASAGGLLLVGSGPPDAAAPITSAAPVVTEATTSAPLPNDVGELLGGPTEPDRGIVPTASSTARPPSSTPTFDDAIAAATPSVPQAVVPAQAGDEGGDSVENPVIEVPAGAVGDVLDPLLDTMSGLPTVLGGGVDETVDEGVAAVVETVDAAVGVATDNVVTEALPVLDSVTQPVNDLVDVVGDAANELTAAVDIDVPIVDGTLGGLFSRDG